MSEKPEATARCAGFEVVDGVHGSGGLTPEEETLVRRMKRGNPRKPRRLDSAIDAKVLEQFVPHFQRQAGRSGASSGRGQSERNGI